jgi:hypothetical protein
MKTRLAAFTVTIVAAVYAAAVGVRNDRTLANHYSTIPTRYRGQPTSGLLGPVALHLTGDLQPGVR